MRESDIIYQSGRFWILNDRKHHRYTVFADGLTHATSDSAYAHTSDGLSLATERVQYLARIELHRTLTARHATAQET